MTTTTFEFTDRDTHFTLMGRLSKGEYRINVKGSKEDESIFHHSDMTREVARVIPDGWGLISAITVTDPEHVDGMREFLGNVGYIERSTK